jgi:protoporphyrinogen oxidase
MAPAGCGSLYVELADRDEPQLSSLMPQVTTALAEMGIIAGGDDIAFVRKRRIDWAYVIFDHDHFPALEVVHGFLDRHRVRATGRYGGWNYSSMGDALRFGRDAAQWAAR